MGTLTRSQRNQLNRTVSQQMDRLRADYRAGKDTRFQSRLTGVSSIGSGADYHYRNEHQFLKMIERARHYQRNDAVVGQAVRRLSANVIQDGFTLDVNTGDPGLDRELRIRWEDWSSDPDQCHSEQEFTWQQIERMAFSHTVVDGDVLALPLKSGSLQMVEAHRLRTPSNTKRNVVHGVLLDNQARRKEYWLTKQDLNPLHALQRVSDIKPYSVRNTDGERQIFHLYDPARFSQRRGVTALAPCSEMVGMHDDIQFATLVKAQIAALIAIIHERGIEWESWQDNQKGGREYETENGYTKTIEGVSAGLEIYGDPGETIKTFSADVPSPEFVNHSHMILTFIAVNLDLPLAVLLLDPSNTNFSGWRGAIDQARLRFRQIQRWLISKLHGPVYRWKVRQWMASDPVIEGLIGKPGINPFGHAWHPPTWEYIEPLKDASADLLQQRNGLNSPRRIQARRGREWNDVSTELVEDNSLAIRKALVEAARLNAEFPGADIHWRELISLPTPDGVTVAVSSEAGEVSNAE